MYPAQQASHLPVTPPSRNANGNIPDGTKYYDGQSDTYEPIVFFVYADAHRDSARPRSEVTQHVLKF